MKLPRLDQLPPVLRVREYTPADLDACVAIYHSNSAEFLPDTPELLVDHLTEPHSYYLVIESAGSICACGGLDIDGDTNHIGLAFGMVHRKLHRHGLGSLLLMSRLALLDDEHDPAPVFLETTLAIEPFYLQFGFERLSTPERRYTGGSYYVSMGNSLPLSERNLIRTHLSTLPVTFECF